MRTQSSGAKSRKRKGSSMGLRSLNRLHRSCLVISNCRLILVPSLDASEHTALALARARKLRSRVVLMSKCSGGLSVYLR